MRTIIKIKIIVILLLLIIKGIANVCYFKQNIPIFVNHTDGNVMILLNNNLNFVLCLLEFDQATF